MHLADVSMKTANRKMQRRRNFQTLLCFEAKQGFWMQAEDRPALLACFIIVKSAPFFIKILPFCICSEMQNVRTVPQQCHTQIVQNVLTHSKLSVVPVCLFIVAIL